MRTRSPVVAATKHGCSPSNSPIEIRPGSSFWLRFSVKIGTNIVSPIDLTFFLKISGWCTYILIVKELLQRYGESKFYLRSSWKSFKSSMYLFELQKSMLKNKLNYRWNVLINNIKFTTNSYHLLSKNFHVLIFKY